MVYLLGSVPGKAGSAIFLRDAHLNFRKNHEFLNYPTFIPVPGVKYASQITMASAENDPYEEYLHDNAIPEDKEEAGDD